MSKRKRILISGGAGMIGQRLVPFLGTFADVISLDLKPVEAASESIIGSVTDPQTVMRAAEGVDAVLHMAYAHTDFENLAKQIDVNLKGAVNVLEACVARKIPRVVFASTVMTAWGNPEPPTGPAYHDFCPVNFYSYTKCCQELLCEMYSRQHDLSALCLRIGQPTEVYESPTRIGPKVGMPRDAEVLVPFDDLCEALRLALLEAPNVRFATLFLVGDYGNNHYDVERLKQTLGFKPQWRVRQDPDTKNVYILERTQEVCSPFRGWIGTHKMT